MRFPNRVSNNTTLSWKKTRRTENSSIYWTNWNSIKSSFSSNLFLAAEHFASFFKTKTSQRLKFTVEWLKKIGRFETSYENVLIHRSVFTVWRGTKNSKIFRREFWLRQIYSDGEWTLNVSTLSSIMICRKVQTPTCTEWVSSKILNFHRTNFFTKVARAGRFGTKGLAITFIADQSDADVLSDVQKRFAVQVSEMPDEIDVDSYSKYWKYSFENIDKQDNIFCFSFQLKITESFGTIQLNFNSLLSCLFCRFFFWNAFSCRLVKQKLRRRVLKLSRNLIHHFTADFLLCVTLSLVLPCFLFCRFHVSITKNGKTRTSSKLFVSNFTTSLDRIKPFPRMFLFASLAPRTRSPPTFNRQWFVQVQTFLSDFLSLDCCDCVIYACYSMDTLISRRSIIFH